MGSALYFEPCRTPVKPDVDADTGALAGIVSHAETIEVSEEAELNFDRD